MIITSQKLIKEIQNEFNTLFPFLQIEFFSLLNRKSKETINKIPNLFTLGNAHKIKELVKIEILPCTIVKDFESDFKNKFGLHAKLYRKSGNLWQEITITGTWTMKQQDKTGDEISTIINNSIRAI